MGSESGRMPGHSPGPSIGSTIRPPSSMKLSTKRSSDGSPLGSSLGAGCPTMMGTEQEAWMTSMAIDSSQSSGRSVMLQKDIFVSIVSPMQVILIVLFTLLGEGKVKSPHPALTWRSPPISSRRRNVISVHRPVHAQEVSPPIPLAHTSTSGSEGDEMQPSSSTSMPQVGVRGSGSSTNNVGIPLGNGEGS